MVFRCPCLILHPLVQLPVPDQKTVQSIPDRIQLIGVMAPVGQGLNALLAQPVDGPVVDQHAGINNASAQQHQGRYPVGKPFLRLLHLMENMPDREQGSVFPGGLLGGHHK
ncbi:hypothetical protein D3C75_967030 [compost metagenome]